MEAKPKSLLSGPPDGRDLGGLFTLHNLPDGAVRVDFGSRTYRHEMRLRWNLDAKEGDLASALMLITVVLSEDSFAQVDIPAPKLSAPFGGSNVTEVYLASQEAQGRLAVFDMLLNKLRSSIGNDLEALGSSEKTALQKGSAKRALQKRFANAIDAIVLKSDRKAHASSVVIECSFESGAKRAMPLGWVVLQVTRDLVGETRELPAKGTVRRRIESLYPEAKGLSETKWRHAWREAGLETLAPTRNWTSPPKKRTAKKSTRTKKR